MEKGTVGLGQYDLTLEYDYWTYGTRDAMRQWDEANDMAADIISSILPEDLLDEVPQGFTQVGHVGTFASESPMSHY